MTVIGKISATEKMPTTIDDFCFWTNKECILDPFDVVKVKHIKGSVTFGVVEEISHITDTPSYLTSYMSNDFGDVSSNPLTNRVGLNYVRAKVVANTKHIYTPVLDNSDVEIASVDDIAYALGLKDIQSPLPCGYLEMYGKDDKAKVTIPVQLNSKFLIGPEGAHLNISGISGLAAKTSYSMFLLKAIQEQYLANDESNTDESVAFIILNVKGRDLLAIDEPNDELTADDKKRYKLMGLSHEPFKHVKYFTPFSEGSSSSTYATPDMLERYRKSNIGFKFKYTYEEDKELIDLLFTNVEDSTGTMESIYDTIINSRDFQSLKYWDAFLDKLNGYCQSGNDRSSKEITTASWRKFLRVIKKPINKYKLFANAISDKQNEVRLSDAMAKIKKNDVFVVDISKLDETIQGMVFGDIIRTAHNLKLGTLPGEGDTGAIRDEDDIPSKIIIFVDELNKYASRDTPKNSPVLHHILDISERGRSLGVILFSAEQFKSAIHDRVKGNCATHAYGRSNAIEISKPDYKYIPTVYKNMLTRLGQGEYIMENPVFRSLLNIKFPKPAYKQFK